MWGEDLLKKYAEKMKDQKKDEEKDEDALKWEEEERVRKEKEFENSFPKFVVFFSIAIYILILFIKIKSCLINCLINI